MEFSWVSVVILHQDPQVDADFYLGYVYILRGVCLLFFFFDREGYSGSSDTLTFITFCSNESV